MRSARDVLNVWVDVNEANGATTSAVIAGRLDVVAELRRMADEAQRLACASDAEDLHGLTHARMVRANTLRSAADQLEAIVRGADATDGGTTDE